MKKFLEIQGKGLLLFYVLFTCSVIREASLIYGLKLFSIFFIFVTLSGLLFEVLDTCINKLEKRNNKVS